LYQKFIRLSLAGGIAVALLGFGNPSLAQTAQPSAATQPSTAAPEELDCTASGQIAKFDGTNWVCTEAPRAFKYVFVTSEVFDGNLGGVFDNPDSSGLANGAHAICNTLAGAAGLPGTYMAWIADGKNSPDTMFEKSELPYMLTDGRTQIADNYADLTDCSGSCLDNPIVLVETGRIYTGDTEVWTNVSPNGTATGKAISDSCGAWTGKSPATSGAAGRTGQIGTTEDWTDGNRVSCSSWRRLYCFEQ
jgi:hypothetical protein